VTQLERLHVSITTIRASTLLAQTSAHYSTPLRFPNPLLSPSYVCTSIAFHSFISSQPAVSSIPSPIRRPSSPHPYPAQRVRRCWKRYALHPFTLCPFSNFILAGVYLTGPFLGKIVDTRGPRPLLITAFLVLLSGYSGIRRIFNAGLGEEAELGWLHLAILSFCSFITGLGGHAGMSSAMNTTAKSFPDSFVSTVILHVLPQRL
jgi:MFS family permease